MADRISTYRQARLVLQIPSTAPQRAYFSVALVGVRGGIPTNSIVVDGYAGEISPNPSVEQVLECLDSALRTCMLR